MILAYMLERRICHNIAYILAYNIFVICVTSNRFDIIIWYINMTLIKFQKMRYKIQNLELFNKTKIILIYWLRLCTSTMLLYTYIDTQYLFCSKTPRLFRYTYLDLVYPSSFCTLMWIELKNLCSIKINSSSLYMIKEYNI